MSTTTQKPAAKGNRTTEIIIGSAAAKLETAVKAMNTAVVEVGKLEEKAQAHTLKVTDLEDKIGSLEQDLKNKTAQNKIELQQAYDADQKAFADKYLQSQGMTAIGTDELEELKADLEEATDKMSENVNKAVGAATSALKKEHDAADALAKMTFEKKEAENTAKITQLEAQVKFLTEQVGYWKKALEDERAAGVERAKASSIGTLNVGSSTGR